MMNISNPVDHVMNHCSRCGAEFKDLRIATSLYITVERLTETSIWEQIPNLDQSSRELLCKDCFDEFGALLEQMNTPTDPATQGRLTEHQLNPLHKNSYDEEQIQKGYSPQGTERTAYSQEELDRRYEEKLRLKEEQKGTSKDDAAKTNPAELLRQEARLEKEQWEAASADHLAAKKAELDRAYERRLAQESANKIEETPDVARQKELDRLYEERLAREGKTPPVPSPSKSPGFPPEQAVTRPDFSGDSSQVDDSIGRNVKGPVPSISIEEQTRLDVEFEKQLLQKSSQAAFEKSEPKNLSDLVKTRTDVKYLDPARLR